MASLTHVCMWTEHGWKRVTASEISRLHPGGTVSARSGIFMCELCGQYVTLTSGNVRDPYFKHSKSEKNKDCPERTFVPGSPITFLENDHGLPIRIKILSSNLFELELGLLPVPEAVLGKRKGGYVTIEPSNAEEIIYSYDRLYKESITYVSIGRNPASFYKLTVSNDKGILNNYWPSFVDGIDTNGAIFDSKTGKKLPYDADVEVGKKYYLIKKSRIWHRYSSVDIVEKCVNGKSWYVYEVCAEKFDGEAACFFLDYHCRLTEEPVGIFPLWPSCIETPYLILHKLDVVNLFFRGDATPKTFPYSYIYSKGDKSGSILTIECNGRQQLLSAGRSKILEYTYLWKNELDFTSDMPQVSVLTWNGQPFNMVESEKLPEKSMLEFRVSYDGEIVISEEGKIERYYVVRAGQSFLLDSIRIGQFIKLYQGMDLAWACHFIKKKKELSQNTRDKEIFNRLLKCKGKEIEISHTMGAMIRNMDQYPLCRKWLMDVVKKRKINEKAFKILKSELRGRLS